jgi:PhzF family phenazine biosynthesis protein
MKHSIPFWWVDAFTSHAFKGNPAVVCILHDELDNTFMQQMAFEIGLSEVAFLLIRHNQNPLLRWFTPTFEIDLCGHATLASAHVYLTEIYPDETDVTFDTKWSGALRVEKSTNTYTMNFPSQVTETINIDAVPSFILNALTPARPIEAYQSRGFMLVYDNDTIIRTMNPDASALSGYKDRRLIVTAKSSDSRYDFISRFFAYEDILREDPVTGSAHCALAPYWSRVFDKRHLKAFQASPRGGELLLTLKEDRVFITGSAITIMQGNIKK